MSKSGYSLIAIVALAGATGLWWYQRADAGETTGYRFATLERGNLESTVSATGTLNAVTTVQVGTQVSGLVTEILTDFNKRVKKGQLLARIDPTLLEQAVRDAEAMVERNNAELQQAQRDYDRNKQLFDRQVLTQSEYDGAVYRLAVANANLKSAQVSLERAQRNLSYTRIYAPIDGVVIERNVDVGQTVAASSPPPALPHRQRPVADGDPRQGGRERHRGDPRGAGRALQCAALPEREVHGQGAAGAATERDGGERRQLHGRRHREQ
ncbi:MAG: efflux RND transporter periplasmic adaptor subunit [Gemmatimonadetes bacterium]|nr:efflux RND transporter periplasmic adaptor subunit [Gemmatimonadota bacterium]